LPCHVKIAAGIGGLTKDSVLLCEQIREAYHRLAEEEQIEKETSSLIESDMSDYLSELVAYEEMLAQGKIKWK